MYTGSLQIDMKAPPPLQSCTRHSRLWLILIWEVLLLSSLNANPVFRANFTNRRLIRYEKESDQCRLWSFTWSITVDNGGLWVNFRWAGKTMWYSTSNKDAAASRKPECSCSRQTRSLGIVIGEISHHNPLESFQWLVCIGQTRLCAIWKPCTKESSDM